MKASTMKSLLPVAILALLAAASPARADATPVLKQLATHNVVWDSPSADMHGSMPIGNGDLAANFWVEPSGDLVFYLSKSDSWDGDQELLKLGRVRIRLDKPFVRDGRPFRQELDLARGCIVVESGTGDDKTTVDFWIDANRPVVNVQIKGAEAFTAQVTLEHWPQETDANRQWAATAFFPRFKKGVYRFKSHEEADQWLMDHSIRKPGN